MAGRRHAGDHGGVAALFHAGAAGGAVLLPLRGAALVRTNHLKWHALRALMFAAMTGINFWALQYLQLT